MHMSPLKCNSFNAGKIGDIAIATKYKSKVESLTKLVKRGDLLYKSNISGCIKHFADKFLLLIEDLVN